MSSPAFIPMVHTPQQKDGRLGGYTSTHISTHIDIYTLPRYRETGKNSIESTGPVNLCSPAGRAGSCSHLRTINSGHSFLACIMNMPALNPFALAG